jgi:hypothetical protein
LEGNLSAVQIFYRIKKRFSLYRFYRNGDIITTGEKKTPAVQAGNSTDQLRQRPLQYRPATAKAS